MSTSNIWPNTRIFRLGLVLALSLIFLMGLLLPLGLARLPGVALAQGPTTRYVATTGSNSGNDCTTSSAPCATVQHAVDVADPGDEIRVATGVYTGVQARPRNDILVTGLVTQVVYISQTVTIRGGYTITNWITSDPTTNPTTLDAQEQGRVLYITGGISPTIESLNVVGGNATGLGGEISGNDAGGGVYIITATIVISNNQVFSNTALVGGGLYFQNCDRPLLMDNLISSNNTVRLGSGGGLFFNNSARATLENNTISNNEAGPFSGGTGAFGGIAFIGSPEVTLSNNLISNNRATWNGGLGFDNSPGATLISNTISNNVANHQGGGMKHNGGVFFASSDNATLINNTISSNHAANHCGGACFTLSHNVTLMGNLIISNTARQQGFVGHGAGLFIGRSQNARLMTNTVMYNKGSGDIALGIIHGGGVYFGSNTTADLIGNILDANEATSGGGIFLNGSGTITLTNNIITDNFATNSGSGLYILGSSPRLLHSTIARNSGGDGSGVHITGTLSIVAMTNTILVSQTVGITATAGNTATLNGVLWYNNTTNYDGDGTIIVTNEYTGDPAFAADGYHLTASSAAIDRGVNAGVNDDIDGDPRPFRLGYDLGADEFSAALEVTKQVEPDPVQAGEQLTYTIRLTNTGNVDLHVTITDTLPDQVTPNEPLTWTPTITAPGGVWIGQFTVTTQMGYSGTLTNVAQVTTEEGATDVYTATTRSFVIPVQSVAITGLTIGAVQTNYAFTAAASPETVTLPLTYVWQATDQTPLINTGGLSDAVSFSWNTPGIKVITVTAANAGGTVVDTHTINICHQGPTNLPSSVTHDLDHEVADWGVFCEGSPTWAKENVTTPSLDGEALRCAITGGEPHSNVHCYRNLLPEPSAVVFTMTTSFLFTPATTCNDEGNASVVQALEFAMNKWQDNKRYEFALQWQNVDEGAPQWRYWDPSQQWVPISPTISQCLEAGKWYTLTLEGEIIDDNVHYKNFMLDQESHPLDITVEPLPTLGEPDRLAVAVQLDGNGTQSPYDLFIDRVSFARSARPALVVTKQADPNPVQSGSPLTYTIHLTNMGNVTLTATITDILPNHVTPTGLLTWTPDLVPPGGDWTAQVVVTVEADYLGLLTNTVQVTTQEGANGTAEATVCVDFCLYLPIVMQNWP